MDYTYRWESNREYIMTPDGLERVDKFDQQELKKGRFKFKIKDGEVDIETEGSLNKDSQYRFNEKKDEPGTKKITDSTSAKSENPEGDDSNEASLPNIKRASSELSSHLTIFYGLIQ